MSSRIVFPELYRFFQNMEEWNEWSPTWLHAVCDGQISIKRIYAFWAGYRAPIGWENGLIEQRTNKIIPWRACRPHKSKKEQSVPQSSQPTLWDRRKERAEATR